MLASTFSLSFLKHLFQNLQTKNIRISGWNLYISINGFLFGEWDVHSMGLFFPNDRDIVDFWSEKVLQLYSSDDGNRIEQILVHMLGGACTDDYGCECL